MPKKFTRTIEDFACDHCGFDVAGNGYTNHCPKCLWSKHVDVNPGDRLETCQGMMKPVGIDRKNGELMIVHCCEKCGATKRNKVSPNDDINALTSLSKSLA